MARYRKVDTRIWNDQKFNELSDDGKLVFFLLMTHPHLTPLGAMRATLPGLASELGWRPERLKEALDEAFAKGMVKFDKKASFIWLPNFLKYNQPESPNVVKSWENYLDFLPECALKDDLIFQINQLIENFSDSFQKALPKGFLKSMPNQEQEQDHKQEQEQKELYMSDKFQNNSFLVDASSQFKSQAIEILKFLNEKTGRAYREVDENLKLIIDRLKSGASEISCRQVIAKKTREWKKDVKMNEYLRPATLFDPIKFEQYVGELVLQKTPDETNEFK